MKQDAIAVERALTAAIGADDGLVHELHTVFLESAARHALAMTGAATAAEWRDGAWRLKGCAASFGAGGLMAAADAAAALPVRDPRALSMIAQALGDLAE